MACTDAKTKIIVLLKEKAHLKDEVLANTLATFKVLNQVIASIVQEYKATFADLNETIIIDYEQKSDFETELRVAGDLLLFNVHSNVFDFDREHKVWKSEYVQNNVMASYVGIISIFNFLYDSFRYKRQEDLGYLIGRVFINKDKHFFMEGKRQLGFLYDNFSGSIIDTITVRRIVESAILYTLDFDLLVPPYDSVKSVKVSQILQKMNRSLLKTGKRVGYKFYADSDEIIPEKEQE